MVPGKWLTPGPVEPLGPHDLARPPGWASRAWRLAVELGAAVDRRRGRGMVLAVGRRGSPSNTKSVETTTMGIPACARRRARGRRRHLRSRAPRAPAPPRPWSTAVYAAVWITPWIGALLEQRVATCTSSVRSTPARRPLGPRACRSPPPRCRPGPRGGPGSRACPRPRSRGPGRRPVLPSSVRFAPRRARCLQARGRPARGPQSILLAPPSSRRGVVQGLAGVGPPALEDLAGHRAVLDVPVVHVGDLELAPLGGLEVLMMSKTRPSYM